MPINCAAPNNLVWEIVLLPAYISRISLKTAMYIDLSSWIRCLHDRRHLSFYYKCEFLSIDTMPNGSHATMVWYILLLTVLTKNTDTRIPANYAFNHRLQVKSWHKRNYFKGMCTNVSDFAACLWCDLQVRRGTIITEVEASLPMISWQHDLGHKWKDAVGMMRGIVTKISSVQEQCRPLLQRLRRSAMFLVTTYDFIVMLQ